MANLSVQVTENVTLNGAVRGTTNTHTISDIENVSESILDVMSGMPTVIGNWASKIATGKYMGFNFTNSKYIRVTNLSAVDMDVAFVTNGLDDQCAGERAAEVADTYRVLLHPGQSHILWDAGIGKLGECEETKFIAALTSLSYIAIKTPEEEPSVTNHAELFVASL